MNNGRRARGLRSQDTADGVIPWVPEDLANAPTRGYDLETTVLADAFLEPMVGYINELGWDVYPSTTRAA